MFYNSEAELEQAILNTGTVIILEPKSESIEKLVQNPIVISAEDSKVSGISLSQIREIIDMTLSKTTIPRFFIFKNAEKLRPEAQNAALKLFEEPKENYHFILQTTSPEALLPTIRSRAPIYIPISLNTLELPPEVEPEVFALAKQLLVADTNGIIEIAEALHKRKDTDKSPRRDFALAVIKTTIELAEKSYFKTKNETFTKKINGLILAHKNISENGIIRLQLVGNLV